MAFDFAELREGILDLFDEAHHRAIRPELHLRYGGLSRNVEEERDRRAVREAEKVERREARATKKLARAVAHANRKRVRCEACGSPNPTHRCPGVAAPPSFVVTVNEKFARKAAQEPRAFAKNACQACGSRVPLHRHVCQVVASAAE